MNGAVIFDLGMFVFNIVFMLIEACSEKPSTWRTVLHSTAAFTSLLFAGLSYH